MKEALVQNHTYRGFGSIPGETRDEFEERMSDLCVSSTLEALFYEIEAVSLEEEEDKGVPNRKKRA